MTSTLDTAVKDWREVLPVVKPFYERFFGEEMPDLEGVVFGPEDLTKPNNLSAGARLSLKIMFVRKKPAHNKKYNVIGMPTSLDYNGRIDKELIAEILIHELAHKNRYAEKSAFGKFLERISFILPQKKYYFDFLLEECVATTSEFCFLFSISEVSLPNHESAKSEAISSIKELEEKVNNYRIIDAFDRTLDSAANSSISSVSEYLVIRYHSDPNLWSKLKSLRTLDDLKKLVREE